MSRLSRSLPLALTLTLGLSVLSCAVPPAPQLQQPARMGSSKLTLVPRVTEATFTQALVTRPTAASIARLDVFPMVETSPGNYQPMKADGSPTVLGDTEAIRVTQTSPDLRLGRPIEITGLAPNTRYRILARAYDANGKLLSVDATSYVDVNVIDDDALQTPVLPVKLADVPFAATTTITLDNGAEAHYATVETQLVTVAGGVETPVNGTTQTLNKTQIPLELKLDGLRADTRYRLNAVMRNASNAQVATASVEIQVGNDDAPAGKTLALVAPTQSVLAGAFPTATAGLQDGSGTAARFNSPFGVAVHASGNIYVTDVLNHAIRKITPAGVVNTLAGAYPTATLGNADGPLSDARFERPFGIAVDAAENVYVADTYNHAIRMIPKTSGTYFGKAMTAGRVTTLAGGSGAGFSDGSDGDAKFILPIGIAVDASGNLYVADTGNMCIRMIPNLSGDYFGKAMTAGHVTTIAGGSGADFTDGPDGVAKFDQPSGIAVDTSGNLYVTEHQNHAIRMIPKSSGTYFGKTMTAGHVTTIAGSYPTKAAEFLDGTGTAARFNSPTGITVDGSGKLYVADSKNHAIRMITPAGVVTTVLGSYPTAILGFEDGTGTAAKFRQPYGIAVDAAGSLYVTDNLNHAIRIFR